MIRGLAQLLSREQGDLDGTLGSGLDRLRPRLYAGLCQRVLRRHPEAEFHLDRFVLCLSGLANGLYLLTIQTDEFSVTKKVAIKK